MPAPLPRLATRRVLVLLIASAALACSGKKAAGPTREAVHALLQKEAQSLKAEGERIDPDLGVKAVWTIEGVDVAPQPASETQPWKGAIRFKIESFTKEPDGSTVADRRQKSFDYLYDAPTGRWLLQYRPSPPAR
jgi:hypothetical protein